MIKFNNYRDLKKDCDLDTDQIFIRDFEEMMKKYESKYKYKNVPYISISPSDFF